MKLSEMEQAMGNLMGKNNLLVNQAKAYLFWAKACKANNAPYQKHLTTAKNLLKRLDITFNNTSPSINTIELNMPTTTDITWTTTSN